MKWFLESNRWKHFVLAIPEGFLLTIVFVLGLATGMEIKDCHYDKDNSNKPIYKWKWDNFDWLDWSCTVAGGLVGQIIQVITILGIV